MCSISRLYGQLTDHVVAEVVLDHRYKSSVALRSALVGSSQDVNNVTPPHVIRILDALFDNVARELVFAVAFETGYDEPENLKFVFRFTFLNDMLDDIVAVLISNHALLHTRMQLM